MNIRGVVVGINEEKFEYNLKIDIIPDYVPSKPIPIPRNGSEFDCGGFDFDGRFGGDFGSRFGGDFGSRFGGDFGSRFGGDFGNCNTLPPARLESHPESNAPFYQLYVNSMSNRLQREKKGHSSSSQQG